MLLQLLKWSSPAAHTPYKMSGQLTKRKQTKLLDNIHVTILDI